ncbi:MAG TPA: hypothetical protein VKY31_16010 [Terriglobia bacterium]|nr:hypothetical protein [Terriglobia bacterium]
MNHVRELFDAIDSPGGHLLVCLLLLILFSKWLDVPYSGQVAAFALGVLARSMGTSK